MLFARGSVVLFLLVLSFVLLMMGDASTPCAGERRHRPKRNQVVFSVPLPQHQVVVPSMLYAPWREGLPPIKLDFKVPTVFL